MNKKQYQQTVKELKIMFKDKNHIGTVNVQESGDNRRALVEIRTKNMILETAKERMYFHGALMKCDNYSIKAENDELIIVFGFEWN